MNRTFCFSSHDAHFIESLRCRGTIMSNASGCALRTSRCASSSCASSPPCVPSRDPHRPARQRSEHAARVPFVETYPPARRNRTSVAGDVGAIRVGTEDRNRSASPSPCAAMTTPFDSTCRNSADEAPVTSHRTRQTAAHSRARAARGVDRTRDRCWATAPFRRSRRCAASPDRRSGERSPEDRAAGSGCSPARRAARAHAHRPLASSLLRRAECRDSGRTASHEHGCGLHFADRHRVHPDAALRQ